MRHKITSRALEDLIELINCHMPIHQSKYYLLKRFNSYNITSPVIHYFCEKCKSIIDNDNGLTTADRILCSKCTHENVFQQLDATSHYFFILPLGIQIKKLLESDLGKKLTWHSSGRSDVKNGSFYKELKNMNANQKFLTIQWNTDGIQIFNSSKISVWPIQVMLNELPYHDQRQNIILTGLWFSPVKPDMNNFLQPFIKELCILHDEGIDILLPGEDEAINFKIFTVVCSVDSVARPMIQKIKQYNGKFGCSYCLNEGTIRDIGRGQCRVYLGETGPPRTIEQHISDCNFIDQNPNVLERNGVKGASVVLLLDKFDIINSLVPDYLHCVLIGVVKTLVEAWFDSVNSDRLWYLGRRVEEVDSRLLAIKPPTEITRTPRSIIDRKQWKASEWRSFLIYYSLTCMEGILPLTYYHHWSLLISSINGLLQENCTDEIICAAENNLKRFVLAIPQLYGENFMKFNVHLLLHISNSVKLWGALWAWSTFPYEHYNGVIGNLFRGTQSVPRQIIKNYQLTMTANSMISKLETDFNNGLSINLRTLNLLKKLNGYNFVTNSTRLSDSLITFGTPQVISTLSVRERVCIEGKLNIQLPADNDVRLEIHSYKRFIMKSILVHTSSYERLKKRYNSVLCLTNGTFINTTHLFSIATFDLLGNTVWKNILLGTQFIPINNTNSNINNSYRYLTIIAKESNNIICFFPEDILKKCVKIDYNDNVYLTPIVNSLERD